MRVLIISDIHANLVAFETVLKHAKGEWDYVWCLGDVVGYGPRPNECCDLLKTLPHLCLAGNHDWAALNRLDIRTFNADARRAVTWTQDTLTDENMQYLADLPVTFVLGEYTLVHASPREPIWEYILDPLIAALNFPQFETPICFVGHTHTPIIYQEMNPQESPVAVPPIDGERIDLKGQRLIINPGSVGQPRDNRPDAAYAILHVEEKIYEHRRIPYDVSKTQQQMRDADMPDRLITRLAHGW